LELPVYTFECLPDDLLASPRKTNPANHTTPSIISEDASDFALNELTREEKRAWIELEDIEKALKQTNGRKEEAARILDLGDADNIYTRIKKYQKKYPHLVARYDFIKRYYRSIIY
jgi:transcriptional regulator with GAF, ATPase, and Fis domain